MLRYTPARPCESRDPYAAASLWVLRADGFRITKAGGYGSLLSQGRQAFRLYALVPVNGKLPIGPMPISPEMLSPETLPVNSSGSGIGLVMETFQATSSPLAGPSKISVELPSAPCVPVSVPPAFFTLSVALRSPIGVLMVRFQFPSTAILNLLDCSLAKPEWLWDLAQAPARGIAHLATHAQSSGTGGADAAGDENAKRDILHGE